MQLKERKFSDNILSFIDAYTKSIILTETGYDFANHGVQVFGGHGFISQHGHLSKSYVIHALLFLYEGTTEIQALDLLGRKVLGTQGAMLKDSPKSSP